MSDQKVAPTEFESAASGRRRGILAEVFGYLLHSKKWWLAPVVLALIIIGILVVVGGTAAAPFIYTLF